MSGATVTQVREGTELIDVVARAIESERLDAAQLDALTLRTASDHSVPVSQIATIEPVLEEGGIWIRNRLPTLSVRADVQNAQAPDVSQEVETMLHDIKQNLPVGYQIQTGGTIEESVKADASIQAIMPIMLLLWAVLLMVQLQSFSRMFMVLLTAPLGMIGVSLALLITQVPFGFIATLGVIALAGMIMRSNRQRHCRRPAPPTSHHQRDGAPHPPRRPHRTDRHPRHDSAHPFHHVGADGDCHHGRANRCDRVDAVFCASAVCGVECLSTGGRRGARPPTLSV